MTRLDDSVGFEPIDFSNPACAGGFSNLGGDTPAQPESTAEAYARGYDDAATVARNSGEVRSAAALEAIASAMLTLQDGFDSCIAQIRADTARLALAFARKLAGRLVEQMPAETIMEAFASLAYDLAARRDVTLTMHPDALAAVETAFGELAATVPSPPRLVADATVAPGDCRIDWPDGGLIRDRTAVEARLEALLDAQCPSLSVSEPCHD